MGANMIDGLKQTNKNILGLRLKVKLFKEHISHCSALKPALRIFISVLNYKITPPVSD